MLRQAVTGAEKVRDDLAAVNPDELELVALTARVEAAHNRQDFAQVLVLLEKINDCLDRLDSGGQAAVGENGS